MSREFKKGDKVRIIKSHPSRHDGEVATVVSVDGGCAFLDIEPSLNDGRGWLVHTDGAMGDKLELVQGKATSLRDLEVGDVVEKTKEQQPDPYAWAIVPIGGSDSIGDKRTVLAILSAGVYAMSKTSQQDEFGQIMTAKDLEKRGYTVQGAEPEQVHLDVSEIEKKMGLQAGTLRIKKGS